MNFKNRILMKAIFLTGLMLGSTSAFAANVDTGVLDTCVYSKLVLNTPPFSNNPAFGTENTTICVDVPVSLTRAKAVFNLDTNSVNGKGESKGLKHMFMYGTALKNRIKAGLMDADDVAVIGVLHGAASKWALKDGDAAKEQRKWIKNIFALANPTDGSPAINIQLEICGVNMMGNGWTKADLYTYDVNGNPDSNATGRILVNQGAIGRITDLQQSKFVYFHEGYELHPPKP